MGSMNDDGYTPAPVAVRAVWVDAHAAHVDEVWVFQAQFDRMLEAEREEARAEAEGRLGLLLWHLTDGRMSKGNYTLQAMLSEVEAAQERHTQEAAAEARQEWLAYAECSCATCLTARGEEIWFMVLCATCGNKRCPHAEDHGNPCTGSNEPGQPGATRYPVRPRRPPRHTLGG